MFSLMNIVEMAINSGESYGQIRDFLDYSACRKSPDSRSAICSGIQSSCPFSCGPDCFRARSVRLFSNDRLFMFV